MFGKSGFVRDLGDGRVEKYEPYSPPYLLENWFAHQMNVVMPQHFTKLHSFEIMRRNKLPTSEIPVPLRPRFSKANYVIRRVYDKIDITLVDYLREDDISISEVIVPLCRICIKMREYGWNHNDLHAGNVGLRNGIITLIDYGAVVNTQLSPKSSANDYAWLVIWMVRFEKLKMNWQKYLPALRKQCPPHSFEHLRGSTADFWAYMVDSYDQWSAITGSTATVIVPMKIFKKYLEYFDDFPRFLDHILMVSVD